MASAGLALALSGCFSAPPQIISLDPNRGSTSVAADAPVQVVFDHAVTRASVATRFSVSPAIPGCDLSRVFAAPSTAPCWIHWLVSPPGFELLHEGAVFRPATRYTFTLAGGFADAAGDANGLDHHWDLTTAAAPLLTSTTPGDRSTGVALDSPLAVSFSAAMDAPSTAAAITLSPPVAGTRVVRNILDHNRFAILPGELLDPSIEYTIAVDASARGDDGQAIGAPAAVRFTTGSRLAASHAAVLAGLPGAAATEVLLPALSPAAAGEPIAAPVPLRAPRCAVAGGCAPGVPEQTPLETYSAAAVAPDGSGLAVVVTDAGTGATHLEVLDTIEDALVADVPGGALPSWSPDGRELALTTPGQVEVLDVRSRLLTTVATATALGTPPLWAGSSTLVLSTVPAGDTPGAVEVADRTVDARFALPGAPPSSLAVAVSPAGTRVALATADGGAVVAPAGGAAGGAQRLPGRLAPLGFAGEGILVAVDDSGGTAQLVRVSVGGGDTTPVTLSPGIPDLGSVRVALDGRRLTWIGVDSLGVKQAYVADADGSGALAMTRFLTGGLQAQAVDFSD